MFTTNIHAHVTMELDVIDARSTATAHAEWLGTHGHKIYIYYI